MIETDMIPGDKVKLQNLSKKALRTLNPQNSSTTVTLPTHLLRQALDKQEMGMLIEQVLARIAEP